MQGICALPVQQAVVVLMTGFCDTMHLQWMKLIGKMLHELCHNDSPLQCPILQAGGCDHSVEPSALLPAESPLSV